MKVWKLGCPGKDGKTETIHDNACVVDGLLAVSMAGDKIKEEHKWMVGVAGVLVVGVTTSGLAGSAGGSPAYGNEADTFVGMMTHVEMKENVEAAGPKENGATDNTKMVNTVVSGA